MDRQCLARPFQWLVVSAGAVTCLLSASRLPVAELDARILLLAFPMLLIASGFAIPIPRMRMQGRGQITISDTFIFLTMLLYGGEAAILLAAFEGVVSSLRVNKKLLTTLFNMAVMALSTFLTVWALRFCFGAISAPPASSSATFVSTICVMALVQYIGNTGIVATAWALKTGQQVAQVWKKYYLWTSITYLAGAAAALIIAKLVNVVGFYTILAVTPIIGIIYVTYRTYLKNIEVMAASAEAEAQARAQAEAAAQQAEQSRLHIEELSHYIAEQERIGKALEESKEHFRHAAFHDALTGMPNRALITDNLKLAIERTKQCKGYKFAVLFLDLDRFKNINDSLGHTVGDQLLVAIARRLEAHLRQVDMVARLGGDEFAILLDGIDRDEEATGAAERIQTALSSPFKLRGHEVFTTTSIGIALSNTGYDVPEDILRDADIAMYRAKEKGKACYEVFAKSMYARAVILMQMENDLRRAIERDEFRIHYQPILSLESGRITGFEALVRWHHPERGLVQPGEFIPVAEETGLILPIGLMVLREACRQLRRWQDRSPAHRALMMSVNLSGKQFMQPDLVERVEEVLDETGLDPRCLSLEITESILMDNAERAIEMVRDLSALGIRLSIDDFGTGYSSLSYLHRFPINTLKIDRSFVTRMGVGGENSEIIRTIVTLARNLGMGVVAEGVETADQLLQLGDLDCDYVQGFMFSVPVDKDAAGDLLLESSQWLASPAFVSENRFAPSRAGVKYLKSA